MRTPEEMLEKFNKFHKENPHVYKRIVQRAREFRRMRPGSKVGIALIWNIMRWDSLMSTSSEVFKLPNDFQPYYSRLVMNKNPDLEGVFETRAMFSNGF